MHGVLISSINPIHACIHDSPTQSSTLGNHCTHLRFPESILPTTYSSFQTDIMSRQKIAASRLLSILVIIMASVGGSIVMAEARSLLQTTLPPQMDGPAAPLPQLPPEPELLPPATPLSEVAPSVFPPQIVDASSSSSTLPSVPVPVAV